MRAIRTTWSIALLLITAVTFAACDGNPVIDDGTDDGDIDVPSAYAFQSRFEDGASSAAYPGQVVRNLQLQDLKIMTDRLAEEGAEPVTEEELLQRYDYDDAYDLATLTGTEPAPTEAHYSAIAEGKSLAGKATSEYGDQPLIGRDEATADELVREYLAIIAQNAQDPGKLGTPAVYTTEQGVNLSQMINKLLMGAVVYSQATGKYLNIALDSDNAQPQEGKPHTEMEHVWDEAFGYFGAARDYAQYSDEDLAGSRTYSDTDGDGQIDFNSEYNFTFATYAGKRDAAATDVDFTGDLFEAFLKGRTAIVNEASAQEIAAYRDEAARIWEQLVAANVVHYLNSTLSDMDDVTAEQVEEKNNEELNEHWSEAKAFVYVLQYNAFRQITDDELAQLHELLGSAPGYALPGSEEASGYREDLNAAKDLLQSVYGFSDANMSAW